MVSTPFISPTGKLLLWSKVQCIANKCYFILCSFYYCMWSIASKHLTVLRNTKRNFLDSMPNVSTRTLSQSHWIGDVSLYFPSALHVFAVLGDLWLGARVSQPPSRVQEGKYTQVCRRHSSKYLKVASNKAFLVELFIELEYLGVYHEKCMRTKLSQHCRHFCGKSAYCNLAV